ncbi:MAG: 50S ribosomal protein L18e [Euryarchaeota archaeon]|nr:50S ribosomal protein L18e [Euryarchaeota archaeon]
MARKKTEKTNPELIELIRVFRQSAREHQAAIWKELARRLEAPSNNHAEVNLSRLNRSTSSDDVVVVPGKVLGTGSIDHPICIAALSFSETARVKILAASGKIETFSKMMDTMPSGSNIKIIR